MLARRERVADITAARQWLLQQGWVARDRISLIGWAHGASAVLWAVRPQQASRAIEPDYRSAIAFYPECRISAGTGWSARVPTLLLIGAKDDISSPPSCKQMVDNARGRSALARIVVYPDAPARFRPRRPAAACAGGQRCDGCPSTAMSAPMPTRAPTRRSKSRRGSRGDVLLHLSPAGRGRAKRG